MKSAHLAHRIIAILISARKNLSTLRRDGATTFEKLAEKRDKKILKAQIRKILWKVDESSENSGKIVYMER